MTNAVEMHGVHKVYPHFTLDEVELVVPTGSVMGFVGPNGAGKSTTLRILMGLLRPDRGEVRALGHSMPAEQIAAKWNIGFVSEDMRLHPLQTIAFHVDFMRSVFPDWDDAYANHLLAQFDLRPEQKVKGLSQGQRMKACLCMVLARKPRLLVLDEPTTGLDPLARQQVIEELAHVLADEERSILFSSHNTADIEQISDSITFIRRGRIVFTQDKESLLDRWRRLRLEIPEGFALPELDGLVARQVQGRLAVLTLQEGWDAARERLTAAGAQVSAIERMTLEEIFLASVKETQESSQ